MKTYPTRNFTDPHLRNLPLGTYKVELVSWREHMSPRNGQPVTTYTFRVPALGGGFMEHIAYDVTNTLTLGDMYATVMVVHGQHRSVRNVRFSHFCMPGSTSPVPAHIANAIATGGHS